MPADLLLLHGFTQTGASWAGGMRGLAGRHRALAPDLGAGPWAEELDRLEALMGDGSVVAGEAGWVVAGYSMGGRLGVPRARRGPEGGGGGAGARAGAAASRAGAAARAHLGEPGSRRRRGAGAAARRRRGAGRPHRADRG